MFAAGGGADAAVAGAVCVMEPGRAASPSVRCVTFGASAL
jgi:hypothetical protein